VPKTGHGLPTDTLGRYADTTVSPPISKAARRITMYYVQAAYSLLTVPRVWVMMVRCRRAEVYAATMCAEATVQRVSAAPSPVRRILAQQ
jgi:hypothetical protein